MYPEFVDSFNGNLKITFNLRDKTQKGVTVTRYIRNRAAHSRTDRNAARRLSVVSPLTDDEDGQYWSFTIVLCSFATDRAKNHSLVFCSTPVEFNCGLFLSLFLPIALISLSMP